MILAVKLLLTPVFIAAVSLAGRRWGPAVSGTLTGLPLTSGPVSLILALQYGTAFAAQAAVGNLVGQTSVCVFCLTYALAAQRWRPLPCAALAMCAFLAATALWNQFSWSLLPACGLLLLAIATIPRFMPNPSVPATSVVLPPWDLPARMVTATLMVLLLTALAGFLGPQLSGLLSPLPVFGTVLAVFAHRQAGAMAASRLLRGVVLGSSAYGCFFVVVGSLLSHAGIGATYALAAASALVANGLVLYGGTGRHRRMQNEELPK